MIAILRQRALYLMKSGLFLWIALGILGANASAQSIVAGSGQSSNALGTAWVFAVSGDSRNCGDVVMPAIAAGARAKGASFYWHLGDFRAMFRVDEDFAQEPLYRSTLPSKAEYQKAAWNDFIENQILPFGQIPVFLGIGNHELIDRTRDDYVAAFRKWLTAPEIADQRMPDSSTARVKPYFHWMKAGVDFINMDNASDDQFDSAQLAWFDAVLKSAVSDSTIRTIVVGMHKALPDSLSYGHSMSESPNIVSIESGRHVYRELLKAQNDFGKKVYILASHSHIYMDGIFNTDFWSKDGGVLPGWIIGTAGAELYQLPAGWRRARQAMQGVYGYLLATVNPEADQGAPADGTIRFEFHPVNPSDVPSAVRKKFTPELVDFCFNQNRRSPEP